jgi:hypothetical protein
MVACTQDQFPQPPDDEHPVMAIVAILAIIATMLLILWARFELHGADDLVAAFAEDSPIELKPDDQRELDAAVNAGRFATGVSPH